MQHQTYTHGYCTNFMILDLDFRGQKIIHLPPSSQPSPFMSVHNTFVPASVLKTVLLLMWGETMQSSYMACIICNFLLDKIKSDITS